MSDIQALVDVLAEQLGRPVGVDDRHFRAVAYSSHPDQIDQVRVASILHRAAPPGVTEWLESLGIAEAKKPVRVPANRGFQMAARICVPLRFGDALLGYMWLIDAPEPLADEQLGELTGSIEELAVSLYRMRRLDNEQREHELVARLLSPARDERSAGGLGGLFVGAPFYGVAALHATSLDGEPASELVRALLADAADRLRREMDPGHLLVDLTAEQAICVFAVGGPSEFDRRLEGLRAAAEHHFEGQPGWRPMVGADDPVSEQRDLPAAGLHAREAVRIAAALGLPGPVIRWRELGSYGTIAALLGDRDPVPLLAPTLRRLLELPDAQTLVDTLETYLDRGGDARAAAAELFIHRSSLYGRLHKIEEATEVDLRSGEDRLELHLGLRLLRLSGSAAVSRDSDHSRGQGG